MASGLSVLCFTSVLWFCFILPVHPFVICPPSLDVCPGRWGLDWPLSLPQEQRWETWFLLEEWMASNSHQLYSEAPSAAVKVMSLKEFERWVQMFVLLFSCSVVFNSLQPQGLQHTRSPCPSPASRARSNSCPSSPWCNPTILFSVVPFPPAFNLSQHQGLSQWVSSKVLELQHQSFQWLFRVDFL